MRLKKVTIYLTEEEIAPLQAIAEEEEVTLCAVVRAQLGLPYRRRGAPTANTNRRRRTTRRPPDCLEQSASSAPTGNQPRDPALVH